MTMGELGWAAGSDRRLSRREFGRTTTAAAAAAAAALVAGRPGAAALAGGQPTPRFDGVITRAQLDGYLSRAFTIQDFLLGKGDFDDTLRMLLATGARFVGRALCPWGGESEIHQRLETAQRLAARAHEANPELMLQACVFEIVTTQVSTVRVPAWAFEAVGRPVEDRNFRYEEMLFADGALVDHWRRGQSVPDVSRAETQMWFHFLGRSFVDAGIEAIHFGQVELIGRNDPELGHYRAVLERVRGYAREQARRGIVLCDGHVPRHGLMRDGKLLLDFHSFPLRPREVAGRPLEAELVMNHIDSLYGRSRGGVTPSGWACESLPYLVEFDNFGTSKTPGQPGPSPHWVWGYDEISWFAHLDAEARNAWLRYAWQWVREHDPNGWVQMPGGRTVAGGVDGKFWYYANRPSAAVPDGFGQEDTIREIWAAHGAGGDVAVPPPV